ncbi:hypothetical protein NVP1087A_38 [Vibrio phage 1.087.A._10N.261.45.F9]|nr:hypothetical protein NVP1087A_38 [Vibrio phage 1.087.A._10N.261.45.F9]
MENMKMSDVFELPVSRDGFKLKDKCGVSEEIHVAKFDDLSACVYAEFAINNHDRLVEESVELCEMLQKTATAIYSHNNEMVGMHAVMVCAKESVELLNK